MKNKIAVLLIEEDKAEQSVFETFFKELGEPYTYTLASSVENALLHLEEQHFDVIVSDINFIDGHVFDILPHAQGIPCIITTARGYEELAVMAIKKGASDYLVRDVERNYLDVLPMVIKKALNHQRNELTIDILIGALRSIDDCLAVLNTDGNIMFANKTFSQTFDLKKNYYMKNILDILNKFEVIGEPGIQKVLEEKKTTEVKYGMRNLQTNKIGSLRVIPVARDRQRILGYVLLGHCNE
jgi:CheY-like chemotaxis protein